MKITQRDVDALVLPSGRQELIAFDDSLPGFGIRLRAGGSKTFIANYKVGAKQRRMTLGTAAQLKVEAARAKAAEVLAQVRLGGDPAAGKAVARVRAGESFETVTKRYLVRVATRLRPNSYDAAERYLLDHFRPLHCLALTAIDRRAVAGVLSEIAATRGTAAADRGRATLSAFFGWAAREGLIDANPAAFTNTHHHGKTRELVLSGAELTAIWHAAGGDAYGKIIKLLILTGCRRAEIGSLEWGEVDLAAQMIHLPSERCKNHRPHDVPLSDLALRLLQAVPQTGPYVFGIRGVCGFCGRATAKRALDARIAIPMPDWVLHDLRRSAATHMAELGIQPHVVEALLNHQSGTKSGVAGVYNRSSYDQERRTALGTWASHVDALVSGRPSNLVTLRA